MKTEVPMYMIFVMYLIVSSNYLAQLFPCRLQNILDNSMLAKHFIGFMTLLFFVVLASGEEHGATEVLTSSIIIYFLFIMSTRISLFYFGIFILLSSISYVLHLYQKENHNKQMNRAQDILQYMMGAVLVVGVVLYFMDKKLEYKKRFSIGTFLIGKPTCRNKSPQITLLDRVNLMSK